MDSFKKFRDFLRKKLSRNPSISYERLESDEPSERDSPSISHQVGASSQVLQSGKTKQSNTGEVSKKVKCTNPACFLCTHGYRTRNPSSRLNQAQTKVFQQRAMARSNYGFGNTRKTGSESIPRTRPKEQARGVEQESTRIKRTTRRFCHELAQEALIIQKALEKSSNKDE